MMFSLLVGSKIRHCKGARLGLGVALELIVGRFQVPHSSTALTFQPGPSSYALLVSTWSVLLVLLDN